VQVAVLDYGMGNFRSVAKALEAAGAQTTVSGSPDEIRRCDGLCVPGQGIFGRCMDKLTSSGMDDLIREWIVKGSPYLGICLGMQVLYDSSEESNPNQGLGILAGSVERLPGIVTVPHMGWNTVSVDQEEPEYYYFDHSYAVHPIDESSVTGLCEYGGRWAAMVRNGALMAVQFHPEKSAGAGITLLKGWLSI
jgi:glutamine amidotransferase